MNPLGGFREIWVADFEFHAPAGERPAPICFVAWEIRSGRRVRQWLWADDLERMPGPMIDSGPDVLFVAYFASAELGCYLALDWPMPARILDLFAEFCCLTNGRERPAGKSLLGACVYYGLDTMEAVKKRALQDLCIRGGPFTAEERAALLPYCEEDVASTAKLLTRMVGNIDVPRALLRGRYMAAVARMERNGTPIDADALAVLQEHREGIKGRLIGAVDRDFGVYDGATFKADRFAAWLEAQGILWPRLESGALDLKEETFREQARSYAAIAPLRELRHAMGELRLFDLAVGCDRRNRSLLSPFASKTGRNQPSNVEFIFGPSCWLRGLIKPESGRAVAYLDYRQQEFGIAAALSGDWAMQDAYRSADPYLRFAIQAGAAPPDATKETHREIREQFKQCVLGVQYGLGAASLGWRIGKTPAHGRELLRLHKQTYPMYWKWSQSAVDLAMLGFELRTVFGWTIRAGQNPNALSLGNFPMQANGAEILRLACSMLTEAGIVVCAPVHDAVLIEDDAERIEETVRRAQSIMERASEIVLDGFTIGTDAKIVRWPDRYMDERGARMWRTVWQIVAELVGAGQKERVQVGQF